MRLFVSGPIQDPMNTLMLKMFLLAGTGEM